MIDQDKLIKSWIFAQKLGVDSPGYQKNSWAVQELINMASEEPNQLWKIVLRILEVDNSIEIIKATGAGPLEDLMLYHGKDFIDKVKVQAEISETFKSAMQEVWLESDETEIYSKFYDIAGIKPPF